MERAGPRPLVCKGWFPRQQAASSLTAPLVKHPLLISTSQLRTRGFQKSRLCSHVSWSAQLRRVWLSAFGFNHCRAVGKAGESEDREAVVWERGDTLSAQQGRAE